MKETDAYPTEITSMYALVKRASDLYGKDTYVIPTERGLDELTFDDLHEFTCKYADFLDEQGAGVGEGVASVFHNSSLACLLFVATIAANRVYVPLNPKMGETEVAHILRQTKPAITIPHAEFAPRIGKIENTGKLLPVADEVAFIKEILARPGREGAVPDFGAENMDRAAEVVFTSGSTGLPKGAVLTHGNLLRNAHGMAAIFNFERASRFLTACPLFHNSGQLFTTLTALWCGGRHVSVRSDFAMLRFWNIVDQYELQWSLVMNAFLALLVQRPEMPKKGTMKGILSGGSKLKLDLADGFEDKFGVPVYQCFGLTETTSISTTERPGRSPASRGSAGKPLPGCRIRIVMDGKDMPPGQEGEILIAGQHLFSHYVNLPEVTADKLRDGWLHTGDLGYVDEEGHVFIVDRLDSMIHVGGENVYPSEIENLSTLLSGVEDVVVTSIPDKILGAELVMVYKAQEGQKPNPASWSDILVQHLSTFKIPKRRVSVEELGLDAIPRAANGKLLRATIRDAVHAKLAPAPGRSPAPRT
jgi:acyl-CoA synthetase (AMP-forming)/AMP-acid ligase II